jgi:hypothetical protein
MSIVLSPRNPEMVGKLLRKILIIKTDPGRNK